MAEVTMNVTLVLITCDTCGIQFGVPGSWLYARRQDHQWWHCPNGHRWHYPGESDVQRVVREKQEAEARLQSQLNEARHSLLVAQRERDAETRKRRKIERRVAKGVCPCCNRTFEDLHRHMAMKHKEYGLPPGSSKGQISGAVQ